MAENLFFTTSNGIEKLRAALQSDGTSELFLFQFPNHLPITTAASTPPVDGDGDVEMVSAKGGDGASSQAPSQSIRGAASASPSLMEISNLQRRENCSAVRIGKVIVYESGKVKMKIGDCMFDVGAGVDANFHQVAAMIQTKERDPEDIMEQGEDGTLRVLGRLGKTPVYTVTPDIDAYFK